MVLRSQNGLTANDRSKIGTFLVPGTSTKLALRKGNVATVLLYVAAQFDRYVEDIDTPSSSGYVADKLLADGSEPSRVFDDWSFAVRMVRGSTTSMSNHSSGSAIDLNATQHPLGTVGNFTPRQRAGIRRILSDCGGVVRWGGDYLGRKDPMHFEINASPARVAVVAARLRRQAKAEAAAREKAERRVAAARRKKATAAAKAKALLLEHKKKAAAAAAAAAAALALGTGVVPVGGPDTPTPQPAPSASATPTPTGTVRIAPVVTPTATASPTRTPGVTPTPKPTATKAPAKTVKPKPAVTLRRVLSYAPARRLQTGADVRKVQALVGLRGKAVDGEYGKRTARAVKAWQRAHKLKADGDFGRKSSLEARWAWKPER